LLGESYHLSFRQKTQCSGESEGCALAVRKSRFDVLGRFDVESLTQKLFTDPALRKLLDQLRSSMPGLEEEVLPRLKTLAQVVVLRAKEEVNGRHRVLIVANTHLFYHPGAPHVRLLQVVALLEQIKAVEEKYRAEGPIGLVLAGDFNSLPGSAVVRLLESGHIDDDDTEWAQGALFRWGRHCSTEDEDNPADESPPLRFGTDALPCESDVKKEVRGISVSHPFHLKRTWTNGELDFTNFVACFRGVLDHIFIDTSVMEVTHKIDGVQAADIEEKFGGLPNAVYGSDHLAMACDLAWKQTPEDA
jgi:2',5'-phosphodiesterase